MLRKLENGFLIIFEGIDGIGKSTQLSMTQKVLEDDGWAVVTRRNLGGTPIGEELRAVMIGQTQRPSETNLYISAAIQAALIEQVKEDRAEGRLILMDRGPLSLATYEHYGSGLSGDLTWPHVDEGMASLNPDMTLIFRGDVEQSLARARRHSADYFESKSVDYFKRVAAGYDEVKDRYENITYIDADRELAKINLDTLELIKKELAKAS